MKAQWWCLIVASVLAFADSSAQWVQTGGPYLPHNVQVHCLVASGSTLFAGTGLGVYRSTDNGSRWIATNSGISVASGLDGLIVNALAVSGPNLFGQLYYTAVSNVDVLSWSLARPPFSAFYQMLQVGTNLFAATNEGLCVSTDNGTTWSVPDSTLWGSSVKALAVSGGSLFACNSRGVFRSTDDGMHWTQASAGLRDLSVGQLVVSSTNLVAGTWHGVFFSTNSGTNWMPAKMNSLDTNTQALAVSGPNVFASTNGGVLISTDNGANWSLANTPFSMFYQMLKIGTILFAASGADFMRSTDDGQTWIPSDTGISCAPVEFLESIRNYLVASTRVDGSFISSDKGTSWEKLNPGLSNCQINSLVSDGTTLYAGTNRGVYCSSDYGSNWIQLNSGLSDTVVGHVAVDGEFIFAGTPSGLFRSTDKGMSWSSVKGYAEYALATNGPVIYLGCHGGITVSTDYGTTWKDLPSLWDPIELLVASGPNVYAANKDGVFLSWDTGGTWVPVNRGLGSTTASALIVIGDRVFAASGWGIYLSTDDGTSWTDVSSGIGSANSFACSGTDLFAGQGASGVSRRPLAEMTSPPYPNLLRNPGFEEATAYWNFYTDGTGEFTNNARGDISPHAGVVELTSPGTNVQLYQSGIHLKAATRYKLTFKTYSNSNHTFKVFLHKHGAPYTSYGLDGWEIDIGGQNFLHETEFTTKNFSDSVDDARLRFWFAPYATAGDRYWIDDVVLQESTDSNMIVNGGFESGTDPWKFYSSGESVMSLTADNRSHPWGYHPGTTASISVRGGSNVQLYQTGIQLQAGLRYVLSFWARLSSSETTLGVYLHKHDSPFTSYGLDVPDVTAWGSGYYYRIEFTAENFTGMVNDGRLRFWMGTSPDGSAVWIDDVVLEPINTPTQSVSKVTRVGVVDMTPTEFALSQNYPNPFNPSTKIQYELPKSSMVRLSVYDILGREVSVLMNERRNAGSYEVQFDAHNLASGVYFYRLQAGSFVQTRKLLLLK